MSPSTDSSTGVENDFLHGSRLRKQLREQQAELKYLRRRARVLTASRDHWRQEAQLWKWGALHR